MKTLKLLLVTALWITLCTGLSSCTTKVYTPDIEIREANNKEYCYYEGKLYTGKIYSSDESCYAIVQNGELIEAYAYHNNGQIAIKANEAEQLYYDEEGNLLFDEKEFKKLYNDFHKSVQYKLPL